MEHVVRRTKPTSSINVSAEGSSARSYSGEGIVVDRQLTLDIEPHLSLSWRVHPSYWSDGFTLLVFHSTTSFCSITNPGDLNLHGRLIIETKENSTFSQVPEEGSHFFTFILHKRGFFKFTETMTEPLRFSETVQSVKVGLGRTRDLTELKNMLRQNEIGEIQHEANLNEQTLRRLQSQRKLDEFRNPPPKIVEGGVGPFIKEESEEIDAIVDTMFAMNQKISEVKKSARYKTLSVLQRAEVMKRIAERFDAGEMSARREARKNQKKG